MFFRLLLLLTVIPILEIYFLIGLSHSIGWPNTILLVLITGILGANLIRKQGHSVFMDLQKNTGANQLPTDALVKGLFTFVGGVLLVTPGILTDALGFSLILPGTQTLWKKYFMNAWQKGVQSGQIHFYSNVNHQTRSSQNPFESHRHDNQKHQFDNGVIDIKASKSETVDKKSE